MGIHIGNSSSRIAREWYPSGPRLDKKSSSTGPSIYRDSSTHREPVKDLNPDPNNYKIVQALEISGYTILKINYPNCTNYEGNKILLFQATLLDLVNQRVIDPHFFKDARYKSPIARFVPTDEGWAMAKKLIEALTNKH